jgi:hypothetical protein
MHHSKIRKITLLLGMAGFMTATAQAQFTAGYLAVLRAGDNGPSQTNQASASSLGGAHQAPTFIDEFDPSNSITISTTNTGTNGPIFSVAIPTNDPGALWFNGHAGTEGYLSSSGDGGTVSFSGYGGDILAQPGTPSDLDIPRGICVIDVNGSNYIAFEGSTWYGLGAGAQTNPRGVVSDDGTNNFFGSGSEDGTEWFNPSEENPPQTVQNLNSSRQVKIINGVFYTSLQQGDGGGQYPQGIYNLQSFDGGFPVDLPEGDAFYLNLVIPASAQYPNADGFDINPQGNIAYIADDNRGIEKYVENNGNWQVACAFAFTNQFDLAPPSLSNYPVGYSGAFGLVVDWSGANPVVYATTTEELGSFINSNRLIRLNDNYNYTDGQVHDVSADIVTLATAWSTNVVFRGLAWAPDRRPQITSNPASQSVVTGTSVNFTVVTTANLANSYEWLINGVQDPSQTTPSYNVPSASADGTYQVIVSNSFGAVTSTVATLTVTSGSTAPVLTSPVPALNLTNAVYDTVTLPVTASGTTPLSYAWYQGANLLSDGGDFTGTATGTLTIKASSTSDSGSYSVVINNTTGTPSSNLVATVAIITPLPIIYIQPVDTDVASNGIAVLSVSAYPQGLGVSFQWYQGGVAMSDVGGHWSGSHTSTLTDLNAQGNDTTNYYVVVTAPGGTVTSAVVSLTVETPAPYSVLPYTALGQVYTQDFDTLPDPGTASVNNSTTSPTAPVPATIPASGPDAVTYDVSNPFDFAAPINVNNSGFGGLNLPAMAGWFSSDLGNEQIQATSGNTTTGLIVSFGCLLPSSAPNYNPLYPTNNRALGMICSPATSLLDANTEPADAIFALRVENLSGQTLSNLNLSYASELWRNSTGTASPLNYQQFVTNWYYVDPLGTNATPTNNWTGGLTNITFATNLGGVTAAVGQIYGTNAPIAITNMAFVNVPLATPWPQGGILWLVWEMTETVSKGQAFGIDNLVFTSGPPTSSLSIQQDGASVALIWPNMFNNTLQYNTNIANSNGWQTLTPQTATVSNGMNIDTVLISGTQEYFRLHP